MVLQPKVTCLKIMAVGEENLILQQFSESVACMAALGIQNENTCREVDARETFRLGAGSESMKRPATESAAAALQLRLRLAVWDGDLDAVRSLLQEWPSLVAVASGADEWDYTSESDAGDSQEALRLAIRLRRLDIVNCLLEAGADINVSDGDGWLLEAHLPRAFPDADLLLAQVAEAVGRRAWANWKERAVNLSKQLRSCPDCDLILSWAFSTWVPALGRLLPQDTVRIRKLGGCLRVDYTLKSFSGLSWDVGRCSVLVLPDEDGAIHFVDHEREKVDSLERKLLRSQATVQERARRQRRRSLKRGHLKGDGVTVTDSGQTADCGNFQNCRVYHMAGLEYTTLVLPRLAGTHEKESSRWKGLAQILKNIRTERGPGAGDVSADVLRFEAVFPDCERGTHHATAEALPPSSVAHIRRIDANVLMSTDFPLSCQHFVAIADAMSASDERYATIKEFFGFCERALPDGFPVRFTIPVIPALSATLSFTQGRLCEPDAALFRLPDGFQQAKAEPLITNRSNDEARNRRLLGSC